MNCFWKYISAEKCGKDFEDCNFGDDEEHVYLGIGCKRTPIGKIIYNLTQMSYIIYGGTFFLLSTILNRNLIMKVSTIILPP